MNSPQNSDFETLLQQGNLMLEAGRFAEALDSFDELVTRDPQAPAAHYFRGLALGNLERHEEAALAFKNALDRAPASLPILFNFGLSCLHTQRWQAALLSLARFAQYNPRSEDYRSFLLLGVAAAEACALGEPLTFVHFLDYEKQHQQGTKYSIDLQEPLPLALLVLCFSCLNRPEEAKEQLSSLRDHDEELASRIEAVLPSLSSWMAQQNDEQPAQAPEEAPQNQPQEPAAAPFDWESANGPLRDHLARLAHFEESGIQPAPEAFEELFRALGDAYLLIPTEGEIENEGEGPVFSLMLRPHDAFDGALVGVAFSGVLEARAFFSGEHTLHRIVVPGASLGAMINDINKALAGSDQTIGALIINPAGPHPYILRRGDFIQLAG